MSKIIASAAIRGAHKIVNRAEEDLKKALEKHGADKTVEFPNTGYFLPVTHAMTGIKASNVGELQQVVDKAKSLLPPVPDEKLWLPYLGHALDAGMATLFADEVIEILKYLQDPIPYTMTVNSNGEGLWLGAANDIIMRERGVEFVDGSAPGFAACVGAPEDPDVAVKIALELQEKNLYVFMSSDSNGNSMAEQLQSKGVQLGWDTRLIPFGKDTTATVFALGFATRAAMAFGGVQPGDYERNLKYNQNRIFAFAMAFGDVTDEQYAQAAGAINFGFPVIADSDIPQILPTGICTYEHVVSNIPHDKMVQKAVEVRGLKIKITKIPIPVSYGPAFEGERIRRDDTHVEIRGDKKPAFEWVTTLEDASKVEDGKIEIIGDEIDEIKLDGANTVLPYGMVVEVTGRQMESDFEPIIERQLHHMINYASGAFHMGQRDQIRLRLSNLGVEKGLKLEHLGKIVHAKIHDEFSSIVDKVQVKIITDEKVVDEWREKARAVYHQRDDRIKGLTDEAVDTFYSCALCQSFAPTHVCVVTPERPGLCGAVNWLDGKAGYQIDASGGHQPIPKGNTVDAKVGQWDKANEYVKQASRGEIERMSAYSMIVDPMTSCFTADAKIVVDNKPIKIGDFVDNHFGSDSHQNHAVLNLNNGKSTFDDVVAIQKFKAPDELVRIKTKTGIEVKATSNHEIAVDRIEGITWVKAEDIRQNDRLISLKNLEFNGELPKISLPKEIRDLSPKLSKELFYLLGLIASDGSISRRGKYEYRFDFINTERQLIDRFVSLYNEIFPGQTISIREKEKSSSFIKGRPVRSVKKCYQVHFNNSVFGYIAEKFGIRVGSKGTWNLGEMMLLPEDLIASFLAGIFDGDGSVRLRKNNDKWYAAEAYLCIDNKEAAYELQLLLKRLGIVSNVAKSNSVFKLVMHGSNCRKFARLEINHPAKIKIFEKIKAINTFMDKSQEQVLPYAAARILASIPESKQVLSSSTLSYYRNSLSRPVISNVQKVAAVSKEIDLLKPYLGNDYFLDIVTEVSKIKNKDEEFVYNITLKDNHTYFINGGPLVKNCGCFECIACILPMTNGIMIVDRDHPDMTPCGMKFSTLAGTVGGGAQTPGFIGHSKQYINSKKFISADGGIKRIVWLPKQLKEEIGEELSKRAEEEGVPDFLDKIADETVATTEEEVLKYITEKGHPVLEMDPIM